MSIETRVVDLTDETFRAEVEDAEGLVVVDFWAPWCAPCRAIAPIIEELAEEYAGRVSFAKLNVDDSQMTAASYRIRSIPTIAFFEGGEPVELIVGVVAKNRLKQTIDAHLDG